MQPAAAPMSAYPSSSSSGFRPQSGSSHSNSVVSPQIPQPSYQNSPASSTPSFHLLNNSSKDASTLAPYSPHPSVPVYDKFYGSSFVSVNPNMTPFTDAIGQTDDPTLDPRKRKRAVESPQNAIPFDPNSPGLPRARQYFFQLFPPLHPADPEAIKTLEITLASTPCPVSMHSVFSPVLCSA